MAKKYIDDTHLQVAMTEYDPQNKNIGHIVQTQYDETVGTITQVYDNTNGNGEQVYAVVPDPKQKPEDVTEVTVLFRGSTGIDQTFNQPVEVWNDWIENDARLAARIWAYDHPNNTKGIDKSTGQLKDSSAAFNDILATYPNAKIKVYGHSLGSMDAQYALANMPTKDESRIVSAHIYNGPNIYELLNPEQQQRADRMKHKIFSFNDTKDFISMVGRDVDKGSYRSVGMVYFVDSKKKKFADQHMTYGYQLDKNGNIKVVQSSSTIAVNETIVGMAAYQGMKSLLGKGGLTQNETIYLDSLQAKTIVKGLKTAAELGQEEMKGHAIRAEEETQELYASLSDVPWGFISSPAEVRSAYAAADVDYHSIVDKNQSYITSKQDKANAIKGKIDELETEINKSIDKMVQDDQDFAKEIAEWITMN